NHLVENVVLLVNAGTEDGNVRLVLLGVGNKHVSVKGTLTLPLLVYLCGLLPTIAVAVLNGALEHPSITQLVDGLVRGDGVELTVLLRVAVEILVKFLEEAELHSLTILSLPV